MNMNTQILDNKGLRRFGITTGVIIVILFAVFFPWLFDAVKMPLWPWILAGLLWVPAIFFPGSLAPVYKKWMIIGHAIGWVNTRIILGLLFFVMVFPMGLVMRLFGNDPMRRKLDKTLSSYRVKSLQEPRDRMEKPF